MSRRREWRGSGGPAVRAYRRALDRLRAAASTSPNVRAGILQAMALTEEPSALRALNLAGAAGWTPLWSRGERSAFHTRLTGHGGPVRAVAFGEVAGRAVVATGGADRTVRLWDPRTGEIRATLAGHTGPVVKLAFGLIGGRPVLVSAGADRTAQLWDAGTGALRDTITLPEGEVVGLAILAADRRDRLVVATDRGSRYDRRGAIDVWDADTADLLGRIREERWQSVRASGGLAVVPTHGGDLLATFADDGDAVLLLDPATGVETAALEWDYSGPDDELRGASFVPPLVVSRHDGRLLLGVTAEAELDLQGPNTTAAVVWWDVRTGDVVHSDRLGVNEKVLAAGSDRFVTVTALHRGIGSTRARIDTDMGGYPVAGRRHAVLRGHAGHVHAATVGTVGGAAVLITAGADGAVLLWDTDTPPPADGGMPGYGLAVVADPARPVLVAGTGRPWVDMIHLGTGAGIGHLRCQAYPGQPGHHCPDLTREAGWYVSNDHCRHEVAAGEVDGRWRVATYGNTRGVPLWDPETRDIVRVLDDFPDGLLRFGPAGDRTLLVTGGSAPRVWDPATGTLLATLRDERFEIYGAGSVAFGSTRGHAVVAAGGTTRAGESVLDLWDPLTAEHLHRVPVNGPAWRGGAPGTYAGARLAAGDDVLACAVGDEVRLWDPGTGVHLATANGADGRITCIDLTNVEGRILLAGGTERGTVQLWTTDMGDATAAVRPVATLATFARPVRAVAVTQIDGTPQVFAQAITGRLTACRINAPHDSRRGSGQRNPA